MIYIYSTIYILKLFPKLNCMLTKLLRQYYMYVLKYYKNIKHLMVIELLPSQCFTYAVVVVSKTKQNFALKNLTLFI